MGHFFIGFCRGCKQTKNIASRGICSRCYNILTIRTKHPPRQRQRSWDVDGPKAVAWRAEGKTCRWIATELRRTIGQVWWFFRRHRARAIA